MIIEGYLEWVTKERILLQNARQFLPILLHTKATLFTGAVSSSLPCLLRIPMASLGP